MRKIETEKRKYQRYDTEAKVYFRVTYDIKTKVKFRVVDTDGGRHASRRYSGLSRNIGAEGLCFFSKKKLKKGDTLLLEVNIPNTKVSVRMEGVVRWSRELTLGAKHRDVFYTGVKLISVNDKPVAGSTYYDARYKIVWSAVLDSILGSFGIMTRRIKRDEKKFRKGGHGKCGQRGRGQNP
jgi:hypothetical protein